MHRTGFFQRGGVLRFLLILLALVALAAAAVWALAFHGADLQKQIRGKGEELKKKVSGRESPPAEAPLPEAVRLPGDQSPAPAAVRNRPGAPRPAYTAKKPPPVAKARHTVTKQDTLYSLAETYYENGRLWTIIAEANGIKDEKVDLKEGMVIVIPGR